MVAHIGPKEADLLSALVSVTPRVSNQRDWPPKGIKQMSKALEDEEFATYRPLDECFRQVVNMLTRSVATDVTRQISTSIEILRRRHKNPMDPGLHDIECLEVARIGWISAIKSGSLTLFERREDGFSRIEIEPPTATIWNMTLRDGMLHQLSRKRAARHGRCLYVSSLELTDFIERLSQQIYLSNNPEAIRIAAKSPRPEWGKISKMRRVPYADATLYAVSASDPGLPTDKDLPAIALFSLAAAGILSIDAARCEAAHAGAREPRSGTKFTPDETHRFLTELTRHFLHEYDSNLPPPAFDVECNNATGTFTLSMSQPGQAQSPAFCAWDLYFDSDELEAEFTENPHTIIPRSPGPALSKGGPGRKRSEFRDAAVQYAVERIRREGGFPPKSQGPIIKMMQEWLAPKLQLMNNSGEEIPRSTLQAWADEVLEHLGSEVAPF